MFKEEYSPYKLVHHLDKIQQIKNGEQVNPVQVHLVPANACNQKCSFCAYRMEGSSSNQKFIESNIIPTPKLLEIIDSLHSMGVKAVQFTGGGEPLIHPGIKEAIRKTKEYGMEIALVTNGVLLDDELIDLLKDVSWVRISMDAAISETYQRTRKKNDFDLVINNIKKLAKVKTSTILGIGFVVNKDNWQEIYIAAKLFKELGVDNIRLSAIFTPDGISYFDEFLAEAKWLAKETKEVLETDKFTVFNLFNDRVADLFTVKQDYDSCYLKDLVPYIGADLNVYTCCILAYNNMGLIGSIKTLTFEELWQFTGKKIFYENHNPKKHCQLPCMFREKNNFLNYCVKKDVKHINFI